MPGMSSPSTHNRQSTMKVHVGACADGFPQQSKFQQQVRHWCSETWWDKLLPDVYLHKAPQCKQVVPGSEVPITDFTSAPDHDLTQRPFLCIGWHAGTVLPFRNSHAALDLMKWRIHFFIQFFRWVGVEVALPQARSISRWWTLGMCVQIQEYWKLHLHAPFFPLHTGLTYSGFIR